MPKKDRTWFAIVNPHAGSGKTISEWVKAQKILRNEGVSYTYEETRYAGHAEEIARAAAARGYRRFVAVGGDGTAHEVFGGIMRFYDAQNPESEDFVKLNDFVLAVIPIGSGNDWIKSHNIPHDTEEVVKLLKAESFALQDVVRAVHNDKVDYMLNIGGIGFDSRICSIVNDQKANGKAGKMLYAKALVRVICNFYSFPVRVVADGSEVYNGDCYTMAFGVGKWSGGGMRQVPDAVLDDGFLDMMLAPNLPIAPLIPQLPKLFSGKFNTVPGIIFKKAKVIEVFPLDENPETIELDGEVLGNVPVRFETIAEQITVLHRPE